MSNQQAQIANDEQARAAAVRAEQILAADYSAASTFEELYGDLSVHEIKHLFQNNETFRNKSNELDGVPQQTTTLAPSPDEAAAAAEAARIAAETPPVKTPEEIQAEADRVAAEAAAAGVIPTVQRDAVEILYDGVEKLGEGSYKLTVDPEDGSPVEIFYGTTQADCFKKLRKSKASATREIRRRAKKVQITDELRALTVETINYPPLLKPLILTPDQVFTLTEQLKDPITVLEATRKLRQASITQEECDRQNEETERRRYSDGYNTAISWIQTHPDFYNCSENIASLQGLMAELNWAVTIKNLDLAYATLVEQGVLLERPQEDPSNRPPAQPASVVPVAAVPAAPPAVAPAPAAPPKPPVAPAAPAGGLPAADKVLRPGSSSTAAMPTRRVESVPGPVVNVLTAEEYNRTPAATVKLRYQREPAYKAAVDALMASGAI